MLEIVLFNNAFTHESYYMLLEDGDIIISHISDDRINKFLSCNIDLKDSDSIAKYLRNNNL